MTYVGQRPANKPVTSADIEDGVVGVADLGANSVDSSELVDGSIDTSHIGDDQVTADKLANSINSAITANTAKTTNATHSGEVTGSGALTIADNIVDEANLKVSNSPVNGYMLTSQSGASGGMTWAEAGGGSLVLLGRSENDDSGTSGGIQFNGCFTNTYRNYLLLIGKVAVETNQAELQVRLLDTSNNVLSGSHYTKSGRFNDAGNNTVGNISTVGTSEWVIGQDCHNADSTPTHASFQIFNNTHTTTNDRIFMTGTGLWHHEAQHDPRIFYFGGSYHGGHHASGIRVETSTGNISDHEISIFGIKAY